MQLREWNWKTLAVCLAVWSAPVIAEAQPGRDKSPLSWDRNISGLFRRYCYHCHGQEDASGDVDLAADIDLRLIKEHRQKWLRVAEALESGEMPPADERQPTDEQRQLMLEFLRETVVDWDCEELKDPGKPLLRKLNRTEYNFAIQDLTGLRITPADAFPPEPLSFGFDHVGDAMTLTPAQVELTHAAAQEVVNALIAAKATSPEAYTRVFGTQGESTEPAAVRKHLARFVEQAFRGPVDDAYVDKLVELVRTAQQREQASFEQAMGYALTAVLMSPRFLFRLEQDQPEAVGMYAVTDTELASRLSFFLWSRPPDEELLQLAARKQLHTLPVLKQQVRRMLADPRSAALVENFFFQWLDLRRVQEHEPDQERFAEFDEGLRSAMLEEVRLLCLEVVQHDLSLQALLDADFTFVNQRLAAFYGLSEPKVDTWQRVPVGDTGRGGLITAAAVLMVQSDPGRTNIPKRGNFIAGRILGTPPPPPPANVPALEAVAERPGMTMRERFELHRSQPDCRGCHAKIDPFGFSLEHFDAIGRWREMDAGSPIDARALTSTGRVVDGAAGLKQYLLVEREAFFRQFASQLMVYALGRGLQASDQCVVDQMVEAAERDDCFSSMVEQLVISTPMLYRRNPE